MEGGGKAGHLDNKNEKKGARKGASFYAEQYGQSGVNV
jgi:hypothetical protein